MKSILKHYSLYFLTVFFMFAGMNALAQKTREAIPDRYKWDLSDIYSSDDAWRKAKDEMALRLNDVEKFKGTLTRSASDLLACLSYNSDISKEATRLFIYAGMHADLDTREMKYKGMGQELQQMFSTFSAKAAFIEPEILTADWEKIDGFIREEPRLEVYRIGLENMFRTKKHSLSEPEERIMALSGMTGGTASSVYGTFKDAEMPRPEVTLSNGETLSVGMAEYSKFRAAPNRNDRQIVFEAFWDNFARFKATYGEMLNGNVQNHIFRAKARHYASALEASLYPKNIPVDVYHSLVENVNKSLPSFHRYLNIKKRMMGLDTLRYLDLYAPAVKDIEMNYTYEEAGNIIVEALKPLGEEYVNTVKKAINERWIDVYPTPGKRSGAYSNGAFYDGHPFILLNYNDLYEDVSTMAHELGHTMQSYFSNKNQPYPLADYEIFVAEVASTFNEVLLFNYMMNKVVDDDVKLSLLMNWLDGFKGTLFRQTQFAEFELKIHETAEKGMPLTGDSFTEMYTDIVKRYYGHEQNICFIDDYISMEWAFIPHFYYNFYVYQYSTSFTASISLAEKVMNNEPGALENYLAFLSAGGSDYPIDLLKKAGVDMTTSDPFEKAMEAMNKVMDEIEKILDKKE